MGNRSNQQYFQGIGQSTGVASSSGRQLTRDELQTTSEQNNPHHSQVATTTTDYYSPPVICPSKITHSFWFQQHSWLHCPQQPAQVSPRPDSSDKKQQQQPANQSANKLKLFTRFTDLVRNKFAGHANGDKSPESRQQKLEQQQQHQQQQFLPPTKRRNHRPSREPQRSSRWFNIKSLSNSATALPPDPSSYCHNTGYGHGHGTNVSTGKQCRSTSAIDHEQRPPQATDCCNRIGSSCSEQPAFVCMTPVTPSRAQVQVQGPTSASPIAPVKRPNPPTSPFRQITNFLSSRPQASRATSNSSEAGTKRSRLQTTGEQVDAKSKNKSTGGFLNNLFVHSPLFMANEWSGSCCSNSAASSDDNTGHDDTSARKRKRKHLATGNTGQDFSLQQQHLGTAGDISTQMAATAAIGASEGFEFQTECSATESDPEKKPHYADEAAQTVGGGSAGAESLMERDRVLKTSEATKQQLSPESDHIELKVGAGHQAEQGNEEKPEGSAIANEVPNETPLEQVDGGCEGRRAVAGPANSSCLVVCEKSSTAESGVVGSNAAEAVLATPNETNLQSTPRPETDQSLERATTEAERFLLPLIQPLQDSSAASSFNSLLSIGLELSSEQPVDGGGEGVAPSPDPAQVSGGSTEALRVVERRTETSSAEGKLASDIPAPSKPQVQCLKPPPSLPKPDEQRAASQPVESMTNLSATSVSLRHRMAHVTPSTGVGVLRSGFKKLMKRQQSVDSYSMARDLKNKLKRQNGHDRNKHQSNEAIKSNQLEADLPNRGKPSGQRLEEGAKTSADSTVVATATTVDMAEAASKLKICIDPYAQPGTFTLPGESIASEQAASTTKIKISADNTQVKQQPSNNSGKKTMAEIARQRREGEVQPPSSLLLPHNGRQINFDELDFKGCITPTYPTHHLPSPKYVQPTVKKHSNASSTLSSNLTTDSRAQSNQRQSPCDLGSHSNLSPNSSTQTALIKQQHHQYQQQMGSAESANNSEGAQTPVLQMAKSVSQQVVSNEEYMRRAQLAESDYDNRQHLQHDMDQLARIPEICDITFLVGETREPICAVKAVLAARSKVFCKILYNDTGAHRGQYNPKTRSREQALKDFEWPPRNPVPIYNSQMSLDEPKLDTNPAQPLSQSTIQQLTKRRDSSPRGFKKSALSMVKSSSPSIGRSTSPQNTGLTNAASNAAKSRNWYVYVDETGFSPLRTPSPNETTTGARGSISQGSQSGSIGGLQQLVVGAGYSAAPAPRKLSKVKKGSIRDGSRITRMFTKRASDPSIKQQNSITSIQPDADLLDAMTLHQTSTTLIIEEFDPNVFRSMIEYIHTGHANMTVKNLLGLLNAADYYALEELRDACLEFVPRCITVDTVCCLLSTAEKYIQYKCTKIVVQRVLEFVDSNANEIFKMNAFGLLPEHVIRLILARDTLEVAEEVKYSGLYTWCEHYCRTNELTDVADVMHNFLDLIQFHKIPTNTLLSEIYPTRVVPDNIFLSALAHQAEPQNFEPKSTQLRRMTLPNPTIQKAFDEVCDTSKSKEDIGASELKGRQSAVSAESAVAFSCDDSHGASLSASQAKLHQVTRFADDNECDEDDLNSSNPTKRRSIPGVKTTFGSDQQLAARRESKTPAVSRPVRSRKSTGGQPELGLFTPRSADIQEESKHRKLRKGSLAQAGINGMVRLSRKLSIKKRFSAQANQQPARPSAQGSDWTTSAGFRRRLNSVVSSSGSDQTTTKMKHKSRISKQQSAVGSQCSSASGRDPLLVGQQILNAYLEEQKLREEKREAEQKQQLLATQALRAASGPLPPPKLAVTSADSKTNDTPSPPPAPPPLPPPPLPLAHPLKSQQPTANPLSDTSTKQVSTDATSANRKRRPIVKSLSTRKSFKDFKHISRRIFMRHSSSKALYQQQSSPGSPTMSVSSNHPSQQEKQQDEQSVKR